MLIAPRPEYLATANERQAMESIKKLEDSISKTSAESSENVMLRIKRLRGILSWRVVSEYDQRLTDAYNHLISLDDIIQQLKVRHHSFIRTRQAATQSYEGYLIPIRQLRTRLFAAKRTLKGVMAKQGRMLETMAINELDRRRKRLEEYQIKARFALAESYDRATKAQVDEEIEQQKQLHDDKKGVEGKDSSVEEIKAEQVSDDIDVPVESAVIDDKSDKQASFKEKLMSR